MNWQEKTGCYIYLFVLSLFVWHKALIFFNPDSPVALYYKMLYYFDIAYFIPYALNFFHHILNFIFIIAIFLFVQNHRIRHHILWQAVFLIKLLVDCVGQNYAYNHIASFFYLETYLGWVALFLYNAIYVPGYLMLWHYFWDNKSKT